MSSQDQYDIRCEWGIRGIEKYFSQTDVFIIVDVLSFSTVVDIACSNGALVYPFQWKDDRLLHYAESKNAIPASSMRSKTEFSLSPYSLKDIPSGTRFVLPSPNGSTLSLSTGNVLTLCGCLRNFRLVAEYAMKNGNRITVIPAGEKWEDGSIRFAVEDWIGAGAVISQLKGNLTPEAALAKESFTSSENGIKEVILNSVSGRELVEKGFEEDVHLASELNLSECVPILKDGYYSAYN